MNTQASKSDDIFGDVISYYGRAQMMEDGDLHDVSEAARREGFKLPVFITRAAFLEVVRWGETDGPAQSESARLRDVLTVAIFSIRRNLNSATPSFKVRRVRSRTSAISSADVDLRATLEEDMDGLGITISLADES